MMAIEADADLALAKALIEARAIAIAIAMEDADSNLFRLATMGYDLRLLDEFRTMFNTTSDEIFMVNIQLGVAWREDEHRTKLQERFADLETRQEQILNAIAIWEACEDQLVSPGFCDNPNRGTPQLLTRIDNARIGEAGTL